MRFSTKALPFTLGGAAVGVLTLLVAVLVLVISDGGEGTPAASTADNSGQLEQRSGIIYPYARTDLRAHLPNPRPGDYGFAQPAFAEPDQALLDRAESLACPSDATFQHFPIFSISLCIPPGWKVNVEAEPVSQVALTYDPDLSADTDRFLFAGLVIASSESELGSFAFCPEPGLLQAKDAVIEVCFYPQPEPEEGSVATAYQLIAFRIQERPLVGFLHASRMFDDAPFTVEDPVFAEALVILANIRFD